MKLPINDCRSLIKFCQAFEHHHNMMAINNCSNNHSRNKKHHPGPDSGSLDGLYHPFCEQSLFAVLDIVILFIVLGAFGFLVIPYVSIIYREFVQILPLVYEVIEEIISDAPVAYVVGLVAVFSGVIVSIVVWEILEVKSRKCGKRGCKGLRKSIEFDIQLEPEECIKFAPLKRASECGVKGLELGKDYKELEAELKKMAPVNGRTVLVFRAPCGCPAGRLEVWGAKRVRRIKK